MGPHYDHTGPYKIIVKIRDYIGPYGTTRVHTRPYGAIGEHTGTYRTIGEHRDHAGPYGTIRHHRGPYRTIWVHICSNRKGIVKESQIDLSVTEGGREGGRV